MQASSGVYNSYADSLCCVRTYRPRYTAPPRPAPGAAAARQAACLHYIAPSLYPSPAPWLTAPPPFAQFKKLLSPGKIGQVLCLGNLTSPTVHEYLRTLAPDVHLVKGPFDVDPPPAAASTASPTPAAAPPPPPLAKVVVHGPLRIGLTHGFTLVPPADPDALLIAARQLDVDVLLWSGGAHRFAAYELEGKFFVNPGSATGALATGWVAEDEGPAGKDGAEAMVPSFCLMDCQGDVLVLYVYTLRDGEEGGVSVEKVSFRKGASEMGGGAESEGAEGGAG